MLLVMPCLTTNPSSNDLTSNACSPVTLVSTAARPLLQAWLAEMERAAGSPGTGTGDARAQAREDRDGQEAAMFDDDHNREYSTRERCPHCILSILNIVKHRLHVWPGGGGRGPS